MAANEREFDLMIVGATSYTAKLALQHLVGTYGPSGESFTYCLVARDQARMDQVCIELNLPLTTPLRVMQNNLPSLEGLAREAKVILNFVGPYGDKSLPSMKLVQACVNEGTHYVDISGETDWCQYLFEEFHQKARENSVKLLPCMGFDYTSFDMGLAILHHNTTGKWRGSNIVCEIEDSAQGASGGTLRTLIRCILEKPLRFDGSIFAASKRNIHLLPKPVQDGWLTPTVMGGGVSGYLEFVNRFLIHHQWSDGAGANAPMAFDIGQGHASVSLGMILASLKAFVVWLYLAVLVGVANFGPKGLVDHIVPAAGTGPPATLGSGFVTNAFKFFTQGAEEPCTQVDFRYEQGCPYVFTAVASVEASVTIIKGPTGNPPQMLPKEYIEFGGVGSGSTLLGDSYRKRLESAGAKFNVR